MDKMRKFKKAGHVVMASHVARKGDQGVDPSYTENQVAEPPNDRTPRTNYPPPPNVGQYQYPAGGAAAHYYSSAAPQVALAPQTPFSPASNYYAPQNSYGGSPPQSYQGSPPPSQGYQGSPPPNHGYQASPPANQGYQAGPPANQGYQASPPSGQPYYDPQFNNYGYQGSFSAPPNPSTSLPPHPINPPASSYGDQSRSLDPFIAPQRADTYHPGYPDTSRPPLQRSWGTAPGAFDSPRCKLCGNHVVNGNCTVCSQY